MDYFASYAEAEDGSSEVSAGTSSPPQPPSDKQQQQQQQQQEQQEEEKQQDEQQQQQQQQEQQQHLQEIKLLAPLNSAPATTQGAELSIQQKKRCLLRPEDTLLNHNPKVIDTEAPIVGPLTPLQESQGGLRYIYRQRLCGDVSAAYLSRAAFNAEYNKFAAKGYAADPSDGAAAAAAAAAVAAAEQGYYQHIVEAPVRLAEFHPQEIPIVSTTPNGSSSSSSSSSSSLYNSSSLYSSSSSSSSMEHMSRRERKAKRPQRNTDVESADYEGPWALYIPPGAAAAAAAAAAGGSDAAAAGGGGGGAANGEGGIKDGSLDQSLDRGEEKEEEDKNKKEKEEKEKGEKEEEENKDCIFHIKNLYDYQGRSWIEYNGIIDGEEDSNNINNNINNNIINNINNNNNYYIPKKEIGCLVGHTGGVQVLRLFPNTAHLLASASLDSTIKIWSCNINKINKIKKRNNNNINNNNNNNISNKLLRCTLIGHNKGIKDIKYTQEGRNLYSISYDGTTKYWDLEYGKKVVEIREERGGGGGGGGVGGIGGVGGGGGGRKRVIIPYCIDINPNNNNIILIGNNNNIINQYDIRIGNKIIIQYKEHLSCINTINFIEKGEKIITSSDDKNIFIWEYGLPVVTKYITDPCMHACITACMHPSLRYICLQSMDNTIVTYESIHTYKYIPKKKYKGHNNIGYAIIPSFSPDGKCLLSGDTNGLLFLWDYKSTRIIKTIKAHNKVCMHALYHPLSTSTVFTCSWDGLIKIWD